MASDSDETAGSGVRGASTSVSRLLLSGGAWSLASRFGQSFVMLGGTMVLARLLAPSDFGVVAISTSLCVLMLVVAEGFIDYPVLRKTDLSDGQLRSLVWAGLGLMAALALVFGLVAPLIEQAFAFPGLAGAIRLSGVIFLTQTVMVAGRAVLRRQHRFRETGLLVVVSALVYVTTAIALALAQWGVWSLVVGQIASSAMLALLLARAAGLSLRWPERFELDDVLHMGGMGLTSRVLAWFWSAIDTIAVGLASSATATGLYSRAYNLSTQVKEPFASLDHPVRQALSVSRTDEAGYQAVFRETTRLILILTTQTSVCVAVMSGPIVALLLGAQWAAATPVFAILALGIPARVANNLLDGDAVVDGDMARMVGRHVLLAVLIGAGSIVAAPYGIKYVAAVVVCSLYLPVFVYVSLRNGVGASWRNAVTVLPALASGSATYGIFAVLQPLLNGAVLVEGAVLALVAGSMTTVFVALICPVFTKLARGRIAAQMKGR